MLILRATAGYRGQVSYWWALVIWVLLQFSQVAHSVNFSHGLSDILVSHFSAGENLPSYFIKFKNILKVIILVALFLFFSVPTFVVVSNFDFFEVR